MPPRLESKAHVPPRACAFFVGWISSREGAGPAQRATLPDCRSGRATGDPLQPAWRWDDPEIAVREGTLMLSPPGLEVEVAELFAEPLSA
jgi:hypothetical protein